MLPKVKGRYYRKQNIKESPQNDAQISSMVNIILGFYHYTVGFFDAGHSEFAASVLGGHIDIFRELFSSFFFFLFAFPLIFS